MNKRYLGIYVFGLALVLQTSVYAQVDTTAYPFIRYDLNRIEHPDSVRTLDGFWQQFHNMNRFRDEQLHIVHFGGSHIQADIYTHYLRDTLQSNDSLLPGARGFIFPYSAAGTNNPYNYKVSYSGEWDGHRSSVNSHEATWGVVGVTATTSSAEAALRIQFRDTTPMPMVRRLVLFSSIHNNDYTLVNDSIPGLERIDTTRDGYLLLYFTQPVSELYLPFRRLVDGGSLSLYGMVLESDDPGIVYHALGVNGSSFKSFAKCELFDEQLPYLHPDLVVISIGTNDTSDPDFDPDEYKERYARFIEQILAVNPHVALLLTVPNDSYVRRRYHNKNLVDARRIIFELASTYRAGVWDLYSMMGGAYSAKKWRNAKIMKSDLVHFTRDGYLLKGQLMHEALMDDYQIWLDAQSEEEPVER
jgi:lysophospholipase L1-like esterase